MAKDPDEESAKVLKDIRRLLVAVVLFGLLAWAVAGLRGYQETSMNAAAAQGLRGR